MKRIFYFISLSFLFMSVDIQATVMPLQDRILFSSEDNEKRLLIVNNDVHAPVLLQSWVDDGSAGNIDKEKNYPFAVIPAVVKMTPGKILNLKILPTEKLHGLPKDRESLFWINLYEIPGIRKSQQTKKINKIEIGLNTQLKVIYRPFKGRMNIDSTGGALKIRIEDGGHTIDFYNPSPYYLTPLSVKVTSVSGKESLKLDMNRMIPPFSNKRFDLAKVMSSQNSSVQYTLVDDAGKEVSFTKILN